MLRRVLIPAIAILAVTLVFAACGDDNGDGNGNENGNEDVTTSTPGVQTTSVPFEGRDPSVAFSDACQKSEEKEFSGPEPVIDATKTYVATITTAKGDIVLELDSEKPVTVNSFVFLACKGYYDGLTFHRVEAGFVIQGGDPLGDGTGGPGYTIEGEFEGAVFDTGIIGMARTADPNSAGSQFFIMLGRADSLDGAYAAFGNVTTGMDVVQQIVIGDVMDTITIAER